jgi:hypothetical protein
VFRLFRLFRLSTWFFYFCGFYPSLFLVPAL